MNSCPEYRKAIVLYSLGHLEPAEARRVADHLDCCPRCRALFQETRSIHDVFASAPFRQTLDLAPGFEQQLRARLDQTRAHQNSPPPATQTDLPKDRVSKVRRFTSTDVIRGFIKQPKKEHPTNIISARFYRIAAVAAVLAVAASLATILLPRREKSPETIAITSTSPTPRVSPLSLNTYRFAAGDSLQTLDDLLLEQGLKYVTPELATATTTILDRETRAPN